ncbi:hypothetical protein SprV_0100378200 [Sparganum proliferum]
MTIESDHMVFEEIGDIGSNSACFTSATARTAMDSRMVSLSPTVGEYLSKSGANRDFCDSLISEASNLVNFVDYIRLPTDGALKPF